MALSTTRTLITQTGINTHQVLNVGGLDSAGIATFSNFKTGSSNLHSTGLTVGDTFLHSTGVNLGTGATVSNNGNAIFSGIITASSFVGDISNASGAAAGLGTALSQTQTDPLNKIYYTNTVLPIESTITVDTPASASAAYTQYADISVGAGADLIISDGDDLIPDVLGLRPDGTFGGGALGRMRVDKLVGKDANSAVSVEKGLVVSGVSTSIQHQATNVNVTGVVTATAFHGSGENLTGLASREVYGFTGIGNSLSLTTTNTGADNIDGATYAAFEESFIGPSGLSFSINTSGNLIMTV